MAAVLRSTVLQKAGFSHAFGERAATEEDVARALRVRNVVQVAQVHGAAVIEAGHTTPGQPGDALIARATDGYAAVGVRVADCVPLLVADADGGSVAAIHAGWRGVVAGVVRETITRLAPRRLLAAIGPCIGPCCFEVGEEVAVAIAQASCAESVVRRGGGKAWVDLRRAIRSQLQGLGAGDPDIEDVPGCTRHEERFHSFRRDGKASGRMLAAICSRPVSQ